MRLWWVLAFIIPLWAGAQERCATDYIDLNTNRQETKEAFSSWIDKKIAQKNASRRLYDPLSTQSIYTVPVVFHIIHNGEAEGSGVNISSDRIEEQIAILNEDYRRQNWNASSTPTEYESVAADAEIAFVLAKQDPEGLPTTGITRTEGSQPEFKDSEVNKLTATIQWPPEDYINIYVTDLKDILGFAIFPFSDVGGLESLYDNIAEQDGVFLDYEFVGNNDDPSLEFESYGRTASHEIGHYFGLLHTFHGGCGGPGDYCADTPLQGGSSIGKCTTPATNTCDEEIRPMIENYMDYTDDACMSLFTTCQKTRMRTVLENSPRRKSLLTSHALAPATIVENDLGIREIRNPLKSNCSPDFTPSVQVRNYGSNLISSFKIKFSIDGQEIETASFSNALGPLGLVVVSFPTPQTVETDSAFLASFEVTEVNGGADGKASNNMKEVQINPTITSIAPYTQSFDSSDYIITEMEEEGLTSQWSVTTAPDAEAMNRAAVLPYFNNTQSYGIKDMLLTAPLDLSSLTSAQLSFKYSYSGRSFDEYGDGLIVGISTDCGQTFHYSDYVFVLSGNNLVTTTKTNFSFTPSSPADWQQVDLNITPYLGMGEIQIAFIGVNGGGNNIYVDDVVVSSANLPAYDIGLRKLTDATVFTCQDQLSPELNIRNYGYEVIDELELKVTINGNANIQTFNSLGMVSGQSEDLTFNLLNLPAGENDILFEIMSINSLMDSFPTNNQLKYHFVIDASEDAIPSKETFDKEELQWGVSEINDEPLFEIVSLEERTNKVLKTKSFNQGMVGSETYLVSPTLKTLDYESAAVRFKMSYASRENHIDNLKILLSNNCGRTYTMEAFNENLGDLTTKVSDSTWVPQDDSDWQTIQVDITEYLISPSLRVALVFTNGQGNSLFLDDVEVLTSSDTSQIAFEDRFTFYPNPAEKFFYMTFNLPEKQPVHFQLVDMSGRKVIEHVYENTLNQRYEVITPDEKGFYLIVIKGKDVSRVERLYIR
ncbi:T9SS-dependent choice-of-anchor J family protein [Marinoscillum sp. MHG1-6]|uniref:T9SS-dependent choice-of-anchor J family protein n=1 Tax=Marinoscillum sp. MHG1-6 TaxID=2959627 RepID=UPI002158596C|nr:choice-of-anchor J domain-containing protein [Marinoscillum sp. MHG1-6]